MDCFRPSPPENGASGPGACGLYLAAVCPDHHLRLPGEPEIIGEEPVGWHGWRRQLLQRTRDEVIVCAQYGYGIFHVAEVMLKQLLLGIGTHQELPGKMGLGLMAKS
jgi:hypothetical protein